ncbi:MAG: hypothetical protein J6S10_01415 [Clostridia bacterium]|nr:hypothetical protein [Clostridia bacterium]
MAQSQNAAVKPSAARRIIFYAAFLFIVCVAQISFFSQLTFLRATPNIALCAVAAVALLDDRKCAVVCGIATGFLVDALGGAGISLSPLTFMLVALICSQIAKKMLPHFLSWLVMLAFASVFASAITALSIIIGFGAGTLRAVALSLLLTELISSYIISIPIFFIVRLGVNFAASKATFKL